MGSAGIFAIHKPLIKELHRMSSLNPTLCRAWVKDLYMEAKGDWNIRVFDVVKNPDGTDM